MDNYGSYAEKVGVTGKQRKTIALAKFRLVYT